MHTSPADRPEPNHPLHVGPVRKPHLAPMPRTVLRHPHTGLMHTMSIRSAMLRELYHLRRVTNTLLLGLNGRTSCS